MKMVFFTNRKNIVFYNIFCLFTINTFNVFKFFQSKIIEDLAIAKRAFELSLKQNKFTATKNADMQTFIQKIRFFLKNFANFASFFCKLFDFLFCFTAFTSDFKVSSGIFKEMLERHDF